MQTYSNVNCTELHTGLIAKLLAVLLVLPRPRVPITYNGSNWSIKWLLQVAWFAVCRNVCVIRTGNRKCYCLEHFHLSKRHREGLALGFGMKNYLSATKQRKGVFLECICDSERHHKAVLKDCRWNSQNPEQNHGNSLVLVSNIKYRVLIEWSGTW